MANKLTNFLTNALDSTGNLMSYQHASRLYVDNYYELSPKSGWLYFVVLNINQKILDSVLINEGWKNDQFQKNMVGILAKTVDLPKFQIKTEQLNQYNRKTFAQTGITYNPLRISFHDDMANATTNLWKSYYNYYYADGNYGQLSNGAARGNTTNKPIAFADNKYDMNTAKYGLNNGIDGSSQSARFFDSIEIFLLNRKRYSSFTLVNPIITGWEHGRLDQTSGDLLESSMTVNYETVLYNTNNDPSTAKGSNSTNNTVPFNDSRFYDRSPSPISAGGRGTTSIFGDGGLTDAGTEIFDDVTSGNFLGAALKSRTAIQNAAKLTKQGIREEAVGILNKTLLDVQVTGNTSIPVGGVRRPSGVPGASFSNSLNSGAPNTATQRNLDPNGKV